MLIVDYLNLPRVNMRRQKEHKEKSYAHVSFYQNISEIFCLTKT